MAELGGSVHELELDLLQGAAGGLGQQGAAQGDRALAGAGDGALRGRRKRAWSAGVDGWGL